MMIRPLPMCSCGKAPASQDGLCIGCYSIKALQEVLSQQVVPGDGRRNPRSARCIICNSKGTHAKNRCDVCYEYRRRKGVDRPAYLVHAAAGGCLNCGRRGQLKGQGRCKTCYNYFWYFGRERRPALFNRSVKPGNPCIVCIDRPAYAQGRCERCYYYKYRHGIERPMDLNRYSRVQP